MANVFSAVVILVTVTAGGWYALRATPSPMAYQGPTLEELDTLGQYLEPGEAAPEVEDYEMFIPAQGSIPRDPGPMPGPAPVRERRLSAILVVGDQPIAIIDDQRVTAGTTLPGGTVVADIDRTEVLLREPDGSLRTLSLSASEPRGSNDF